MYWTSTHNAMDEGDNNSSSMTSTCSARGQHHCFKLTVPCMWSTNVQMKMQSCRICAHLSAAAWCTWAARPDSVYLVIICPMLHHTPMVKGCRNKKLSSRSFKVTDVGTNRKLICDFLLVNKTNLHRMSQRFSVITQCHVHVHVYFGRWTSRCLAACIWHSIYGHLR